MKEISKSELLKSFLAVGKDNKANSAEDRYQYVSVDGLSFVKSKLLPDNDDIEAKNVVRVDLELDGQELIYYTNSFQADYFAKFTRGTIVNLTAKRWYDEDGNPEYKGRKTVWTIDELTVAAVKASAPITE